MAFIKRIFVLFIEFFQVIFLSLLGIYSKEKRTKAMNIIISWNKSVYVFLFVFMTLSYIYGVAFYIHILNYIADNK